MDLSFLQRFVKMEGCGNHFVISHRSSDSSVPWEPLTRRLLDPHFGIGGDGLLIIQPSRSADFSVEMRNPDGSRMGMCGNGIRCVARYVVDHNLSKNRKELRFDVDGREILCRFLSGTDVEVDMGSPNFDPKVIPVKTEGPNTEVRLEVLDNEFVGTALSMGNPHYVIFTSGSAPHDPRKYGPLIEKDEIFPARTNVEFVEILARDHLRVNVWERGVGITLACGTGACAALVAGVLSGRVDRKAKVSLPGGDLLISWDEMNNRVFMIGPTRIVYTGNLSEEFFEGLSS